MLFSTEIPMSALMMLTVLFHVIVAVIRGKDTKLRICSILVLLMSTIGSSLRV